MNKRLPLLFLLGFSVQLTLGQTTFRKMYSPFWTNLKVGAMDGEPTTHKGLAFAVDSLGLGVLVGCLDSLGDLEWKTALAGSPSGTPVGRPVSALLMKDGSIALILTGGATAQNTVVKLSDSGQLSWAFSLPQTFEDNLNGTDRCKLIEMENGDIVAAWQYSSTRLATVWRFSASGQVRWTTSIISPGSFLEGQYSVAGLLELQGDKLLVSYVGNVNGSRQNRFAVFDGLGDLTASTEITYQFATLFNTGLVADGSGGAYALISGASYSQNLIHLSGNGTVLGGHKISLPATDFHYFEDMVAVGADSLMAVFSKTNGNALVFKMDFNGVAGRALEVEDASANFGHSAVWESAGNTIGLANSYEQLVQLSNLDWDGQSICSQSHNLVGSTVLNLFDAPFSVQTSDFTFPVVPVSFTLAATTFVPVVTCPNVGIEHPFASLPWRWIAPDQISLDFEAPFEVSVISMSGQVVLNYAAKPSQEISFVHLPAGIYTLRASRREKVLFAKVAYLKP